ncbi:MAG: L-threonylcarbamoyladenylate synthase, partial [Candidatus Omnitrophica bacterium]|nr:L-threonylcarbamoyladenylate synthase [Candidatus Omnitrophota bacterium]
MPEIWKIDPKKIDHNLIAEAARRIDQGQLVIFPTETVYGVAVNLLNESALKRIYEIKRRPEEKPLTLHIADRTQVDQWAIVSAEGKQFMDRWWPGPVTVILEAKQ